MNKSGRRGFGGGHRRMIRNKGKERGLNRQRQYTPLQTRSLNSLDPYTLLGKINPEKILGKLKEQAHAIKNQLTANNDRIKEIEHASSDSKIFAVVVSDKCTGCGICENYCPTNAISVNTVAMIDESKCTGCGQCFDECPQGAITLIGA